MENFVRNKVTLEGIRRTLIRLAATSITIIVPGFLYRIFYCFQFINEGGYFQFFISVLHAALVASMLLMASLFFLVVADNIRPIWEKA